VEQLLGLISPGAALAGAPQLTLETVSIKPAFMKKTNVPRSPSVMAVGAHADDIEIEAGGTLEKYFRLGYAVDYVMSTNNMSGGVNSLDADGHLVGKDEPCTEMMARRKRECADATREWKTEAIHLDYPQRHYRNENLELVELRFGTPVPPVTTAEIPCIITAFKFPEAVRRMADLILEKDPECIFTHNVASHNPEHFGTALLVTTAYWQAWEQGYRGGLLFWIEADHPFLGHSYRRWETFVDYSPHLNRKMEMIGKHQCQMPHAHKEDFPHRLVGLDRGKACGCLAAEWFVWCNRPVRTDSTTFPTAGPLTNELFLNQR